jgi:hypothetical protein
MAVGIVELQGEIETAIKAIAPDYRDNITFKLAPKMAPLADLDAPARASLATREFQVVVMPEQTILNYNLGTVRMDQRVRVSLRYYIPPADDGFIEVMKLSASDAARIHKTLATRQWDNAPAVGMCDLQAVADERAGAESRVHVLHLDFVIRYFLGDVIAATAAVDIIELWDNHTVMSTGAQLKLISQHLSTDGAGGGTISGNADYSSTPGRFYIKPPAGSVYRIARLLVHIQDSGAFAAGDYGNGISLTGSQGVYLRQYTDGTTTRTEVVDFMNSQPVQSNAEWGARCYDLSLDDFGSGDNFLNVRWTFTKAGQFIRLVGDDEDFLEIELIGDFSGLTDHEFFVQGYIESE